MALSIKLGGTDGQLVTLAARNANRHGLIAGATGTGKTVSLQSLAEGFSRIGVPVFMSDVKGDLSGLARPGKVSDRIAAQFEKIGVTQPEMRANPVLFWDLFGKRGHPVRTTISDMGPLLLGNLLELNEAQTGILYSAFSLADENGLLLLDMKDLTSMLNWMSDNARDLRADYGNVSAASVGAIRRRLLILEEQGAEHFFGEPALNLNDLMITDFSGLGVINVLDATELMQKSPRLYATFLLWLLAELFEQLPEAGDADKPKLVLFFDEAHLLFDRAPRALVDKIEQVVRLIRSKGVGVFFVSQSPLDIPADILGQLAARVQHALRAFTPKDKKAVRSVADTFRPNPRVDTQEAIGSLAIGEALVSVLDDQGAPTPVERIFMLPPTSRLGPLSDEERVEILGRSPVRGRYDQAVDRESAFELLKRRADEAQRQASAELARQEQQRQREIELARSRPPAPPPASTRSSSRGSSRSRGGSNRQGIGEAMLKSVARSVGSSLGRKLVRGILGSLMGGR